MREINYKNALTAIEMLMEYATAFDQPDELHMVRYEDAAEKCTKEYMIDLEGWRSYREFGYNEGLVVVHISDTRLMLLLVFSFGTVCTVGSFFSYDNESDLICNLIYKSGTDLKSIGCEKTYWEPAGYGDAEDFVAILEILSYFYDDVIDDDWREYNAVRDRMECWCAGGAV